MFSGMVRLKNTHTEVDTLIQEEKKLLSRCGPVTATEGTVSCRSSFRRPGCMKTDLSRQQDRSVDLAGRTPCLPHKESRAQAFCPSAGPNTEDNIIKLQTNQSQHGKGSVRNNSLLPYQNASSPVHLGDCHVEPSQRSSDIFNSSFSFIQQSLDSHSLLDIQTKQPSSTQSLKNRLSEHSFRNLRPVITGEQIKRTPEETEQSHSEKAKTKPAELDHSVFINEYPAAPEFSSLHAVVPESNTLSEGHLSPSAAGSGSGSGQSVKAQKVLLDSELLGMELDIPWHTNSRQVSFSVLSHPRENMPDSDAEVTSSLSVDSDSTSASSVTSGYESATSSSDQNWDDLIKRYEGVIQGCLQDNRANFKMESMVSKLQRLQQKAVLDDDYDTAEHFGKKLEELRKEQASLKPSLPSRHPKVAGLLERLTMTIQDALRRTESGCRNNEESTKGHMILMNTPAPQQRRKQLLREKEQIQKQISELQQKLKELQDQSLALEEQLKQENLRLEVQELEGPMLRSCSPAQLRLISQALEDVTASEHRVQISLSPSPCITRLQEQEQALSVSIKEATAKVVMSQRLGGSLRRKVSESETQLLALHEAKLAAISGSDFSCAKELKAEMRSVYRERDRLEGITKRLQDLSTRSTQDLASMKEQHSLVKQELQKREAHYEQTLKENTLKYIELLEDRLHNYGSPALERIWEADLETCHLLLRGLQLCAPSCSEMEELPLSPQPCGRAQTLSKAEEDSTLLTALGGHWCPETNLQHSAFTQKLDEFLFCLEDSQLEDLQCDEMELKERCQLISKRLLHLEEQLQNTMHDNDQDFTRSLEKEVQTVKAVLQEMLSQLKESDTDEEEQQEDEKEFHSIEDGGGVDEDQYFSDSWEI